MSDKSPNPKRRLTVLDHLRGFFIIVIILDHLGRWPSLFGLITGKGLLWVTAAEGFVIISGLLVGYVRGFKNRALPLIDVSIKLWRRAILLFICSIIASIIYTAIFWYAPVIGGLPAMPIDKGEWSELIFKIFTFQYTYMWVHFLTLYALFLAASPLAIWLMRINKSWLVVAISLVVFTIGRCTNIESLQWQALFFIPSVAGYHLEAIQSYWKKLGTSTQAIVKGTFLSVTIITILLSVWFTFYADQASALTIDVNLLFDRENIGITSLRVLLALTWFTGFLFFFQTIEGWLRRHLDWLLMPFGARSLSAYIVHGVVIVLISLTTYASDSIIINTFLGVVCILAVWGLLKSPLVQKTIPA